MLNGTISKYMVFITNSYLKLMFFSHVKPLRAIYTPQSFIFSIVVNK